MPILHKQPTGDTLVDDGLGYRNNLLLEKVSANEACRVEKGTPSALETRSNIHNAMDPFVARRTRWHVHPDLTARIRNATDLALVLPRRQLDFCRNGIQLSSIE